MLQPIAKMPSVLYTAEQCRELDRIAIDDFAIPGFLLMQRAGGVAFDSLMQKWPQAATITVFCGTGNNGGDGYIVAALATQRGIPVELVQVGDPSRIKGDAALALRKAREAGVSMQPLARATAPDSGVIVDALLGTGTKGAPRGDYEQAIKLINESALPVLAIDLPSGLNADTGHAEGACVRAQITTTFIGAKRGLFTGQGPVFAGSVIFDDLAVPPELYPGVPSEVTYLHDDAFDHLLKPRDRDAHKGHFGHVLVIGGDIGMGGAVLMAAEAAGRVGAGLVSVATRPQHVSALLSRRPEFMVHGLESMEPLDELMARATVLVLGPGLGKSTWSREVFERAITCGKPTVVDADALNLLAEKAPAVTSRNDWVLTPHPGEASRLLNQAVAAVQADRFAAVRKLQHSFGGVVVLKGVGSLVASKHRIALSSRGNPGMATGGMGDVLSGVIAGLLAQGLEPDAATEAAVLLHGRAADRAARDGERGMLATDLFNHLRSLVNPL